MPIKYIGKTTDFKGKTLWEIVGNLKNFGVGRIVARNMHEKYPEASYMKIVKVETLPNPEINTLDDVRKVTVWVERTFRGRTHPELVKVQGASYKADYKLIPKNAEKNYCKCDNPKVQLQILPSTMSFPPLLKEIIKRELQMKGTYVEDPQCKVVYQKGRDTHYRIAEENEKPTTTIKYGFGTPLSPKFYDIKK